MALSLEEWSIVGGAFEIVKESERKKEDERSHGEDFSLFPLKQSLLSFFSPRLSSSYLLLFFLLCTCNVYCIPSLPINHRASLFLYLSFSLVSLSFTLRP